MTSTSSAFDRLVRRAPNTSLLSTGFSIYLSLGGGDAVDYNNLFQNLIGMLKVFNQSDLKVGHR